MIARNNHKVIKRKLFARLVRYFFRGLLISIPLVATGAIILWLFQTIDNLLGKDHLPGIGILIILSGILLVGMLGSSYVAKPFIDWFDDWLERTPGIKFLYSSLPNTGVEEGPKKISPD